MKDYLLGVMFSMCIFTVGVTFLHAYEIKQLGNEIRETLKREAVLMEAIVKIQRNLARSVDIIEMIVDDRYPVNTNKLIVRNASFRDILSSPIMNIKVTNNIFSHFTNRTNSKQ